MASKRWWNYLLFFLAQDEDTLEHVEVVQRSAFLGSDTLFDGTDNQSFFINRDKTGFYVFFQEQGTPQVRWVRGARDMDPHTFQALGSGV